MYTEKKREIGRDVCVDTFLHLNIQYINGNMLYTLFLNFIGFTFL